MSQHTKKQSQLERIILFTDAVFAIAITLLAIEIKVPELHEVTEDAAKHQFLLLIPRIIGFLISFFVIGVYWIAHHKIFSFVVNYDRKLLWLNLLFLMFIILLPFTTGFYSEYTFLRLPFLLYSLNILLIGIMQARLLNYVSRPTLSEGINIWLKRYISYRGLVTGVLFTIIALIQYVIADEFVPISRTGMFLIGFAFYFLKKFFEKKGVDVKNY